MVKSLDNGAILSFNYVNHRGVDERRTCSYRGMQFGTLPNYYETPTLLMIMWCFDRKCMRSFSIEKMRNIEIAG